jgi:hypothetical protein
MIMNTIGESLILHFEIPEITGLATTYGMPIMRAKV